MNLRVPHPRFVRVGSYARILHTLFSSLLLLPLHPSPVKLLRGAHQGFRTWPSPSNPQPSPTKAQLPLPPLAFNGSTGRACSSLSSRAFAAPSSPFMAFGSSSVSAPRSLLPQPGLLRSISTSPLSASP